MKRSFLENGIMKSFLDKINLVSTKLGVSRIKLNEALTYHTAVKSDGVAEGFYIATSQKELEEVLNLAYELEIPCTVIGGGLKISTSKKYFPGLVIKNRANQLKISGIKGKVGREGVGIEEALIEVDSGVSLEKLNEYLESQKLQRVVMSGPLQATIGEQIFSDEFLKNLTSKVKVWESGGVWDIDVFELKEKKQIVLSVIFKVFASTRI